MSVFFFLGLIKILHVETPQSKDHFAASVEFVFCFCLHVYQQKCLQTLSLWSRTTAGDACFNYGVIWHDQHFEWPLFCRETESYGGPSHFAWRSVCDKTQWRKHLDSVLLRYGHRVLLFFCSAQPAQRVRRGDFFPRVRVAVELHTAAFATSVLKCHHEDLFIIWRAQDNNALHSNNYN